MRGSHPAAAALFCFPENFSQVEHFASETYKFQFKAAHGTDARAHRAREVEPPGR